MNSSMKTINKPFIELLYCIPAHGVTHANQVSKKIFENSELDLMHDINYKKGEVVQSKLLKSLRERILVIYISHRGSQNKRMKITRVGTEEVELRRSSTFELLIDFPFSKNFFLAFSMTFLRALLSTRCRV